MTNNSSILADSPDGAGLLLLRAQPDIYRDNAFRITRLRVDATSREVQRHVEKAKMMDRLGAGMKMSDGGFALDPPPNLDAVREARQRLLDPERRLIEELFWFWPRSLGEGCEDQALEAVARGEVQQATALWIGQQGTRLDGAVAVHNLAVLAHASALDLEHAGRTTSLNQQDMTLRETLWPQAFKHWRVLLEHDDFWRRLSDRIQTLDDPRVTLGTAERIRQALPLALLLINARLAARSIEAGQGAEAERHCRLIQEAGFENRWKREAFHLASEIPRQRIIMTSKSTEEAGKARPDRADRLARQMIEQTRSSLATLDLFLSEDDDLRQWAHDEVALQVLACQILYGRQTEDWKTSTELLDEAYEVAAGEAARARIEENIQIVRNNLQYQLEHGVCYFCGAVPPDDEVAAEVKLYGDVERLPVPGGTQIRWRGLTAKVPRCLACRKAQAHLAALMGSGIVLGALAGLGGCLAMVSSDDELACAGVVIMVLLGLFGAGAGWIIGKIGTMKGVRSESASVGFPPIQRLLAEGWSVGEKPPDAQ